MLLMGGGDCEIGIDNMRNCKIAKQSKKNKLKQHFFFI